MRSITDCFFIQYFITTKTSIFLNKDAGLVQRQSFTIR
ncbi:hypothetical protein J2Z58_003680 [Halobacillus andaensis]|nr:hypothetical protein [Halobacillus andaensis]